MEVGFYVNPLGIQLNIPNELEKLAMRVFTSGDIVYWPSPCGSNCSYTVDFDGPAYRCVDTEMPTTPTELDHPGFMSLYNTSLGIVQVPVPPYDSLENGTNVTQDASDGIWIQRNFLDDNFTHATHCKLYAATYTTTVNYTDNIPDINTTVVLHQQIFSSITEEIPDVSVLDHMEPSNTTYALANFYAIEQAVEQVLQGSIVLLDDGLVDDSPLIQVSGTSLITLWSFVGTSNTSSDDPITFPSDFSQRLEQVLMNTTISITNLLQNSSSGASPATYTSTNATILTYPSLFVYSPGTLWTIYGTALALGCIWVAIGLYLLFKTGLSGDMSFSQIMVTTRNARLDRLCYGAALGQDFIPKELRLTRLKYGEAIDMEYPEGDVKRHVCFGLDKEVAPISKDKIYV